MLVFVCSRFGDGWARRFTRVRLNSGPLAGEKQRARLVKGK